MKEWARPYVEGEPEACAILAPSGSLAAAGLYQLSGLAGILKNRSARGKAGGLGKRSVLLAKTADRLYAFDVKPAGRNWKVKAKTGEWPLAEVRVTTDERTATNQVAIDVPSTGEHYELEAAKMMDRGINDPFFRAIGAS